MENKKTLFFDIHEYGFPLANQEMKSKPRANIFTTSLNMKYDMYYTRRRFIVIILFFHTVYIYDYIHRRKT